MHQHLSRPKCKSSKTKGCGFRWTQLGRILAHSSTRYYNCCNVRISVCQVVRTAVTYCCNLPRLCIRYNYSVVVHGLRYTYGTSIWYQYISLHPAHGTTQLPTLFESVIFKLVSTNVRTVLKLMSLFWSRLVHASPAMHATLAALGTILSPIGSGPSFPDRCPCKPRRPRGEMPAVSYCNRYDTRLLPASGAQPRSAQIHPVLTYNRRLNVELTVKTVLKFFGLVR